MLDTRLHPGDTAVPVIKNIKNALSQPSPAIMAFAILAAMAITHTAWAKCDGIPLEPQIESCSNYTDRQSCGYRKGCQWFPEPAFIRICNEAPEKVSIAVQYVRPGAGIIVETGWWNLETGECNNFEAPNSTRFSYFAKSYEGNRYWAGNLDQMCFDPTGQRFDRIRKLSETGCGEFAGIRAWTSIDVKDDDFHRMAVSGPGHAINPVMPPPAPNAGLKAVAVAWDKNGQFASRHADTLDEAKQLAMTACEANGASCSLAVWLGTDRQACLAIVKNGTWLSQGWSYFGPDEALRFAQEQCARNNITCEVAHAICNDNWNDK